MDWLLDGFNATVLASGQSGTGKSASLLGAQSVSVEPLLPKMLHSLFSRCNTAKHQVGLSVWEIMQQQLVDLLVHDDPKPLLQVK